MISLHIAEVSRASYAYDMERTKPTSTLTIVTPASFLVIPIRHWWYAYGILYYLWQHPF